jgi:hypothetical protein
MKHIRCIQTVLIALLALSLMGGVSGASPYIRSVSFSKDPLILDQAFDIRAKVRNVESSMEVWVYLDYDSTNPNNLPYKKLVVGPDSEDVSITIPKEDWGVKLNLKCGTHSLKADLVKSGQVYDSFNADFNVGNVPLIIFDPARPLPGSNVKIYFKDPETEDPLTQLKVDIAFQGEERSPETLGTDSAGFINYNPTKPGKYKLTVQTKKEYCGEMYFYAKRNMLVDGPKPANPLVGDMITIAVPSGDIGVKVYDSIGDLYLAARTMITGAVNFTITDPGQYTLVMGETSTRYWSLNKTVNVSARPELSVSIEPSSPYVKSPVTISVSAAGIPVANARVKIITPEGVQREYTTLANGKVIYDGVATMGDYMVVVESLKYTSVTKTFKAKNGFRLEFDPQTPMLNSQLTVTVKDQGGIFVPDAEVNIDDSSIVGATDSEGKFTFRLSESNPNVEPREYAISVMKDMYWAYSQKIQTMDSLDIRSPGGVEVANDVNVVVYNSRGGVVSDDSTSVKITSPDGTITSLSKASFTFKPVSVGDYSIEVNKNRYTSASSTITVTPHPLSLSPSIEGKSLVVKVESNNAPVEGLVVSVATGDGKSIETDTTDAGGISRFSIKSEGEMVITANERDFNSLYDVKSETRFVRKSYRVLVLFIIFAVLVGGAILIAVIIWHFRTLGHRQDRDRFEKKGGYRLSKF